MARISLFQIVLAIAALGGAMGQTVTTTVVKAGTTYVEQIITDSDGDLVTSTISTITSAAVASSTSSSSSSSSRSSSSSSLDDEDIDTDLVSASSTSSSSSSSSSRSSSSRSSTSSLDDIETDTESETEAPQTTTTKTKTPVPPYSGTTAEVPAGTMVDASAYNEAVSSRYASRLAEYSKTAILPSQTAGNGAGALQASAMMVAAGVVAAVYL